MSNGTVNAVAVRRVAADWHVSQIWEAWQGTIAGIIETGRRVQAAKDDLPDQRFSELVRKDLPFGRATAYRLMAIAGDPRLVAHVRQLPSSWGTLAEITRLPDDKFEQAITDGTITPEVTRSTILKLMQPTLLAPTFDVSPDRYGIVMCDPPWRYEHVKTTSRAIENQYPTMSLDEICCMPINNKIDTNAIMFMWVTAPKAYEAMKVLDAWEFTFRTHAVWDKQRIGMGYYFRIQHEDLFLAVRGNAKAPTPGSQPTSMFSSPRGKHSEKPVEVYEAIEKMYPNHRKLEMFQRTPREGWDGWGNESA